MPFSITPEIAVDLNNTFPATLYASGGVAQGYTPPYKQGQEVWGNDGKRYVFAVAGATITASTTTCNVTRSGSDPNYIYTMAATGGSYTSPAVGMVTGDFGWFSAASV